MPAYSKTTFVASSAPGISATELNKIGDGIAAAVTKDGSDGMTAALPITQALSGSTKTFVDLNASDGKEYLIRIDTSGNLIIRNATDSVDVLTLSPKGGLKTATTGGIPTVRSGTATAAAMYTGSGTPSGDGVTTPQTGAVWVKA